MVLCLSPFIARCCSHQVHQRGVALQQEALACGFGSTRESSQPQCNPHDVDLGKPGFPFHQLKGGSTLERRNLENRAIGR